MTTALVLGGGADVQKEWASALALGSFDFVVACNDVGAIWPGRLDAWVTLHPEKLTQWRNKRLANGFDEASRYLVHVDDFVPAFAKRTDYLLPGQQASGSSGLFAVKAALIDLGADRVVVAGIGLMRQPHFYDRKTWEPAVGYREPWAALSKDIQARIRSMGGWTASFFGLPTKEWIKDGSTHADLPKPILQEPIKVKASKQRPIIYEPHPVSVERKRELLAQGYRIIDAIFAPKGYVQPTVEQRPDDSEAGEQLPNTVGQPSDATGLPVNDGLDDLDAAQLHAIAKERGIKVHHASGADKVREALRAESKD